MSDHIPDVTKMINDTPRTDEQINGKPCTRFEVMAGDSLRNASVPSEFARELERELNAANDMFRKLNIHTLNLTDRINQLEEAGDDLYANCDPSRLDSTATTARKVSDQNAWRKAKEAKP